jgi:hypothetical protein
MSNAARPPDDAKQAKQQVEDTTLLLNNAVGATREAARISVRILVIRTAPREIQPN